MAVFRKFMQSLLIFVLGSIITEGFFKAVKNKSNGRTILGRKKTPRRTFEDLNGEVHLSPEDGKVA